MTCVANAQATRTWVSGVGDDANPCSRTAPCKTFAGAISKTTAGGEIDALDPAGYGAVTITKAITIDGGGQVASTLVSGINGIVIQAGSGDVVTLRNISINGLGTGLNGVRFLAGRALHIEHCTISGFAQNGIDIEPSTGGQVTIVESISRDNGNSGIYSKATSLVAVIVSKSDFDGNFFGVLASDHSQITIRDSEASGNGYGGFLAQANSGVAILNLVNSTAANNGAIGVQVGGGSTPSTVRMTGVSLLDNGSDGVEVYPLGTFASFGNNYNSGGGTPNSSISSQ